MNKLVSVALWPLIAIVGAFSFAALALGRGEHVSAVWLVTAALCVYFIAYRFYSKFIANKVLRLDDTRVTPAERHNDGMDYVPTNKYVLYGHHFAAIAGAGPLVGPVLATQMGFLPGTLWILVGVVLAGAVQDFIVLFASVRRDGKSLGEMIKMELGPTAGSIAMVGILAIMIIILAVLSLVVVKALADSPWGLFTIAATIPIALIMGVYMRMVRPGRVGEASVIGVVLLMAALIYGQSVANDPVWGPFFTWHGTQLAWAIIIYGAVASSLPVWLMLAPRDYLSTFLKIGTIVALAIGIYYVAPPLAMPATTRFIDGSGPVFSGSLVSVPVHHHRLRFRVGLPCADFLGHHAQDGGKGIAHAADRIRRHAHRVVRRDHGAHCRKRARSGHLFRHEFAVRRHRHHGGERGAGHFQLGLHDNAGNAEADGGRHWREFHSVAHRRRADACRGNGADPGPGRGRQVDGSLLVSLRHPVRGAVHPDRGGCRHARRAAS